MLVWLERHQVSLYIASIVLGAAIGLVAPKVAPTLALSINPVLALLLFATFLSVPLIDIAKAFGDTRFLVVLLILNFAVVPMIALGLSRFVAYDQGLMLGVLLVLLTPCVDYVIVFTGLAGGAREKLLASAPLLMILQLLLLPLYLWLFADNATVSRIEVAPFVEAFIVLIALPLAAAALVQWMARAHPLGQAIKSGMSAAMVPLMMATLAVVVGSQIPAVNDQLAKLIPLIPIFIGFLMVAVPLSLLSARIARLDSPTTRAVIFSGATRNSLVVLPLALALPGTLALAPLAVVTQTLVELIAMVVFVRLVPRLAP